MLEGDESEVGVASIALAGKLFDVTERSDYVQTIVGKCIDEYVKRREKAEVSGEEVQIDSRLEAIVQRMFSRCLEDGQLEQAIGIDEFEPEVLSQCGTHSALAAAWHAYQGNGEFRCHCELVSYRGSEGEVVGAVMYLSGAVRPTYRP